MSKQIITSQCTSPERDSAECYWERRRKSRLFEGVQKGILEGVTYELRVSQEWNK